MRSNHDKEVAVQVPRPRPAMVLYAAVLALLLAPHVTAADGARLARAIREADGCPGGLQIVVGAGHVDLAIALARTGKFDTQILVAEPAGRRCVLW